VNPHLLVAIAEVESGLRADAVGRNRDGSVDLGLMQINSRWLPELRRHGLSATDLMHPCVSVHVGAWVLAQAMQRHGNTWTAVGAYHAGPGPYRDRYVRRVQQALARRMPPLAARVAALAGEPAAVDYSAMSALEAERVPGSGTLDASR
jgi:soluble lytic murein transglycosylase-like protein